MNREGVGTGGPPGHHSTRTMAFDKTGRLYVSIGSASNVDTNSFRARIRRFNLTQALPQDVTAGEVYADGLRNEVGLAFDRHGVLWGVENGADNLMQLNASPNQAQELVTFPPPTPSVASQHQVEVHMHKIQ